MVGAPKVTVLLCELWRSLLHCTYVFESCTEVYLATKPRRRASHHIHEVTQDRLYKPKKWTTHVGGDKTENERPPAQETDRVDTSELRGPCFKDIEWGKKLETKIRTKAAIP